MRARLAVAAGGEHIKAQFVVLDRRVRHQAGRCQQCPQRDAGEAGRHGPAGGGVGHAFGRDRQDRKRGGVIGAGAGD